ncbi:MAG: hypothetical protein CVV64_09070 [Candidatus Wallbacteria bacterium HGW-Wallbacteria-1]|jgi:radical SAM superfamily enzyme YgiQ (UPF0313 family)|uniref:Radical SAM core domain-containing protein n=1 Tax=Candidatus Wallbacteria bacterium HGW-Wallbacteria-1 TaxID=2013854 RepID=A0A2N1PQ94_9BACT|nr:MAG: hypothetical protein CVV64_09070 [Candidatus Wallbacteria bacterium HGW-Wallbacteria-1]
MKSSDDGFRVAFGSPPLAGDGLRPLLLQNRQFKYTHSDRIRIYPLIPSSFVTLCHDMGMKVLFLDALAANLNAGPFLKALMDFRPHLIMMETKAPVIGRHGAFIDYIRPLFPGAAMAIAGDHVTCDPAGSLKATGADFAVVGGDWDYYGALLAYELSSIAGSAGFAHWQGSGSAGMNSSSRFDGITLPPGCYMNGSSVSEHQAIPFVENLSSLPWIKRELTGWKSYGEAYLLKPAAYILSGRGCGGRGAGDPGKCIFCVWQHTLWGCTARLRDPQDVADEIAWLHSHYGVAEVFDDNEAGPCWDGEWLEKFASRLSARGVMGKVRYSCNARADSLVPDRLEIMRSAGFRLLKVGLESGSDRVLSRLGKAERVQEIIRGVKAAKDFGLNVLITTMVGYPWEREADAEKTLQVARGLLNYRTGFGDSLQASVIVPYPGTPLWRKSIDNGWLLHDPADYEKLTMDQPALKSDLNTTEWVRRLWSLHLEPGFMLKSLVSMRSIHQFGIAFRGLLSLLGHLRDYGGQSETGQPPPWLLAMRRKTDPEVEDSDYEGASS